VIPVGFYRPDMANTNPGVSGAVLNAILQRDALGVAYGPQAGPAVISASATALPAAPRGGFSFVASDGSYKVIVGTETNLYLMSTLGVWTSIGSGYALPAGNNWSATQFGHYAIFTNTADGMVAYDLDGAGTFAAVSGAPAARYIFNLFGTLAALDCDGANRVMRTSKANDHTVWTGPGANFREFEDGQELMAGGEIGPDTALVFQRDHIRLLTRRPDRYVFNATHLADGVGASNPECVIFTRGAAYSVDTFNIHLVTASGTQPIGEGKVARTFHRSLASNALNTMQGFYDPEYGRVGWRYQSEDVASETYFEDILVCHPTFEHEFVPLEITSAAIVSLATPAYTLEDLDSVSGSLDALPYSLDSQFWKGGRPRLGIINSDLKFAFLAGDNLACTLPTGVQSSPKSLLIRSVVPDTDCASATVKVGVKDTIHGSLTLGTAATIASSGRAMLRGRGKHFALQFNAAAGLSWTFMRGFRDLDAAEGGVR
jgi:hypothetical protein